MGKLPGNDLGDLLYVGLVSGNELGDTDVFIFLFCSCARLNEFQILVIRVDCLDKIISAVVSQNQGQQSTLGIGAKPPVNINTEHLED